jgi:excisionase family DNA binding protein
MAEMFSQFPIDGHGGRNTMTNKADEWLTGKEAAALLKLTVRSIEKHRAKGRLPFHKSDTGSVRYRRCHVEALLKPGTPTAATVPAKSWQATRWTSDDALSLPSAYTRVPSRKAEFA